MQEPLNKRIDVIDALRGFTLLGIVIAHMTEQYYAGMHPEQFDPQKTSSVVDKVVSVLVGVLITGKFFMIFSFLFGMSFFIQLNNAKGDPGFLVKFSWRLILLFGIGFIHHLHYRGDILTIYAMLGVVLLLTYRLPDNYLLWIGLLLVIDVPGILVRIIKLSTGDTGINDFIRQDQTELLQYYQTFKSGEYIDLLKENLASFKTKMIYQVWSGRLYITAGLFVLGLYAGRKKFFENISAKLPLLRRLVRLSAWTLLGVIIVGLAFFAAGNGLVPGGLSQDVNIAAGLSFSDILNACLAVLYVAWFMMLFQKDKWNKRLMKFYEAGRMGLTTYIMQSFFGLLIFSTIGLGMLDDFGASISFLIAIVIFIVQIVISKFWLQHFNYGPIEWIWRCFTNLKWVPLIRK
ncbi:MAG TPA: DUF418 domain-containing protein [Cyclobacteriaceae bacterium]|nr:DUF418 domain-containing protein [Cyclobacteriaceae bacterium]